VYFLYVDPFRSFIVSVYYVVLIRPIFVKRHCILICVCVCGPVVGLGLYDDAPDTCSAADDCGAYVNDRERENCIAYVVLRWVVYARAGAIIWNCKVSCGMAGQGHGMMYMNFSPVCERVS